MAIRDQVQWARCNVFMGEDMDEVRTMSRGEFLPADLDIHQTEALRTIGAVRTVEFHGAPDESEPEGESTPDTGDGTPDNGGTGDGAPEQPNLGDPVAAWREYASDPRVEGHMTPEEANSKSKADLINQFRK